MAVLDESRTLYQCRACLVIGQHEIGQYKTVEVDGHLFDADMPDDLALSKTSEKFEEHVLMKCDGSITHHCLDQYVQLEFLEPASPLSKLFSKRIRALKCPHCGFLTELSRLP